MAEKTQWKWVLYHKGSQVTWASANKGPNGWTVNTASGGTAHPTSEKTAKTVARDFVRAVREALINEGRAKSVDLTMVEI